MRKKVSGKRVVATAMAMVMTASLLAGCGSSEKKEDVQEAAKESTDLQFDSVKDVTFPLEDKLTLTVFVNEPKGNIQNNYVTDWIEEKTNIHLDFVYDVTGDEAKTKLNLLMTDPDSLPDLLWTTCWTKAEVQQYGKQGLIIPLNDYLEDAENWNSMNEESPGRRADLTMSDGNIYTYGKNSEAFHTTYCNRMWIYTPWVDKLMDGKVPETTEELYEFLTKVKNEDPNGNGQADEIPMSGFIGGWATDPTVWMMNSFVQCNNLLGNTDSTVAPGFIVNDGRIEYVPMKEEFREGLRYINKLFKEGLLDNQTFTQDSKQYASLINLTPTEGSEEKVQRVAVYAGGGPDVDDRFWTNEPGLWEDWQVLEPVEGPEGVRLASRGLYFYFSEAQGIVTRNCKYPEIAVALYDFLTTEEATLVQSWGPEGVGWEYNSDGVGLDGEPSVWERLIIEPDYDWKANFGKDYTDNYSYNANAKIIRDSEKHRNGILVADPDYNTEYYLQEAAKRYAKYAPELENIVPNLIFEGEDAKVISESTVTIGGYVSQALVSFVTGAMDLDKEWDGYIKKLEDMGVQNYIDVYQRSYDSYMENQK